MRSVSSLIHKTYRWQFGEYNSGTEQMKSEFYYVGLFILYYAFLPQSTLHHV